MMKRFLQSIACLLMVVGFVIPQQVHAIGISPGYFEAHNLATGNRLKRTVYVTRANPSRTEFMNVTTDGEGGKYISLSSEVLELPKGKQQTPFVFYITPKNAPNGEHNAIIRFTQTESPNGGSPNGLSTIISINTKIKFFVTDKEVRDFSLSQLKVVDTEVDQPIVFSYQIENTGNVDVRPERVVANFTKDSDKKIVVSGERDGASLPAVAPSENQTVVGDISVESLAEGLYRGSLQVFDKGEVISEISNATFMVHPRGTLQQKIEFADFLVNRDEGEPGVQFRFDAKIRNAGSANAPVLLSVDIYRDGKNIETVRSERQYVVGGGAGQVSVTYIPKDSGSYTARAYLEYGPQRTEEKTVEFKVAHERGVVIGLILIVVALLILLFSGIFMYNKFRKNHAKI